MNRMDCGHDEEGLILYAVGELEPELRAQVEARMASCDACRRAVESVAILRSAVPAGPGVDFGRAAEARARAMDRIERTSPRARVFRWRQGSSPQTGLIRWAPRIALGALLIAVGYALASMGASSAGAGSSPQFVVEEVGIDPVTGDVVARLSNGDGEMLRGGLEQPDVQSALVSAVRQQGDLRIRLHALRTVEQGAATSFSESDPLVRAMLEVLRTENSDAVRLRAVQALDRLFEGEELPASARETLLSVVTGAGGPAVRIAALDALVTRRLSPESTESLVRLAESDPNSYVRLTAAAALDAAGPLESVP